MTTTRSLRRLTLGGLLVTATLFAVPAVAVAGDATVSPVPARPGETIDIVAQCGATAASASISATVLGGASTIPLSLSHQRPGDWVTSLTVPGTVMPGTYELGGTCGDGEGFTAVVVVASSTGPSSGGGWAMTGPNETLLVSGSGILLTAIVAGALLLRRRSPVPARARRHGRS